MRIRFRLVAPAILLASASTATLAQAAESQVPAIRPTTSSSSSVPTTAPAKGRCWKTFPATTFDYISQAHWGRIIKVKAAHLFER